MCMNTQQAGAEISPRLSQFVLVYYHKQTNGSEAMSPPSTQVKTKHIYLKLEATALNNNNNNSNNKNSPNERLSLFILKPESVS